jgi:hypothetical protein
MESKFQNEIVPSEPLLNRRGAATLIAASIAALGVVGLGTPEARADVEVEDDPPIDEDLDALDAYVARMTLPTAANADETPSATESALRQSLMTSGQNLKATVATTRAQVAGFCALNFDTQDLATNLSGTLPNRFRNIDYNLSVPSASTDTAYSSFQVEELLDRASSLLERCMNTRQVWDELSAKSYEHFAELHYSLSIADIAADEVIAGTLDTALDESILRELLAKHKNEHYTSIAKLQRTAFEADGPWHPDSVKQSLHANKIMGWLSGRASFKEAGSTIKYSKFNPKSWDGQETDKTYASTLAARASKMVASRQLKQDLVQASASLESTDFTIDASRAELKHASTSKSKFIRSKELQIKRLEELRKLLQLRANVSFSADGVLNYTKRLTDLKVRFTKDFQDAYAQLLKVREGMQRLYGYSNALPAPASSALYDGCLLWVRDAAQYILRFQHSELAIVFPISLRKLTPDHTFWGTNFAPTTIKFSLEPPSFQNWRCCRLRGLSAYIADGMKYEARICQFSVLPPKAGKYKNLAGEDTNLDQSNVPKIYLSRVAERNSSSKGDIYGVKTLQNLSPWGEWELEALSLLDCAGGGAPLQPVLDIQMELHISYRAV